MNDTETPQSLPQTVPRPSASTALRVTGGIVLGIICLICCLVQRGRSQSFMTNGLVIYFPFTGNLNDASGNGDDAQWYYNPVWVNDRFGIAQSAVESTNGPAVPTECCVWAPYTRSLGNEFSICAWVKPLRPNVTNDARIVSFEALQQPSVTNKSLHITGNVISFYVYPGYPAVLTAPDPVTYDRCHSAVATLSADGMRLYVEGVMVTNNPGVTTAQLNSGIFRMGHYICADFDEVRIYNRALSPSEVSQLYLAEAGPFVNLIRSGRSVQPLFSKLTVSSNYQLQVSADLSSWTNAGDSFTATSTNMIYPQPWNLENSGELFFRLQEEP